MAPPLSELSDSALWVRYVQLGDERSIKVLQERYAKRFMAFVVEKVIDRADAEDILQDAWIRMLRSAAKYDPTKTWSTWAYTIVINTTKNWGRSRSRRKVDIEGDFHLGDDPNSVPNRIAGAISHSTPEEMMEERHLDERLRTILRDELDDEEREIFMLRYIDELSNEEVAQMLGRTKDSVSAKAKRTRTLVRDALLVGST